MPPLSFLLLFASLASAQFADLFGTLQSAAATGRLMCNGRPASGVKVKLYDHDTLDPDDLMDESTTDSNGHFRLSGNEREHTSIDPKVNIYHYCNNNWPCPKKFSIFLPKTYVNNGPNPRKTFDIGVINLAGEFEGESVDCIN